MLRLALVALALALSASDASAQCRTARRHPVRAFIARLRPVAVVQPPVRVLPLAVRVSPCGALGCQVPLKK